MGNKNFDFSSKKKDFLPKNDQIWPKIGIFGQFGPGHAGLFGTLLAGWLVVVARGLYLAIHLFTFINWSISSEQRVKTKVTETINLSTLSLCILLTVILYFEFEYASAFLCLLVLDF